MTLPRPRLPGAPTAALAAVLALTAALTPPRPLGAQAAAPAARSARGGLSVPVDYYTLPNGLRVVLSRDTTAPTAVVAVYYNIGFRNEPRDRTGFAHLFEHLMFQGSGNLGKMEFIKLVQANGGLLNGSTRFDFTNYFEVVPSHVLETALWAESDRMRGLQIDRRSDTTARPTHVRDRHQFRRTPRRHDEPTADRPPHVPPRRVSTPLARNR